MRNRRSRNVFSKAVVAATVLMVAASACTTLANVPNQPAGVARAIGRPASFQAHGSVGQVWLTGAPKGVVATIFGPQGQGVITKTDARGSLIFRNLKPGPGYVVQVGSGSDAQQTSPVRVLRNDERPSQAFFDAKQIGNGYQYVTMRDGIELAIMVRLPGPADQGPYPTLIEYSGYTPADPNNPQPGTLLASALGYATVGVNIRGTGCSGGAFQFFEQLQSTDGYDIIESIAAQPWVFNNKVGMTGISYPAIAQLFSAQTQPPHLAAITPLSVIDDTYRGTLYPGGILNSGFALGWAAERQNDAKAAPEGGQGWARTQILNGDTKCLANQALRRQSPNVLKLATEQARWYTPKQMVVDNGWQALPNADALSPGTFAHKINVPVFLAGAWDDEQTGPHFANMLDKFKSSPHAKFTLINGNHTESLSAEILVRWYEFVEFYVAGRIPQLPAAFRAVGPSFFTGIFGPVQPFPADRFDNYTDFASAKAAFEAEPQVRVLFENGAGCPQIALGAPCPTFETSFDSWPPKNTQAAKWYLSSGGKLTPTAPPAGVNRYTYSGDGQATTFNGSTSALWVGLPVLNWPAPSGNNAVSFLSDALPQTTVMAGTGRLDLQLGAKVPDVDVEVTLTEVRADGTEYYVQTGWLRASHRKLDASKSSQFRAVPTHAEVDAQPLPSDGSLTSMSIELMPFAHVFHAGSKVRIIVDVPGGSRPHWKFDIKRYGRPVEVTIGFGGVNAANIVLPIIPGLGALAPTALPPCPSLRGQPCRTYVPYTNK